MGTVTIDRQVAEETKAELVERYYRFNFARFLVVVRREQPLDTGRLRALTTIDPPRRITSGWLLRFRATASYARVVYTGHGVIVPKRARALRWVTKEGRVVFARRVGPVPPNRYYLRAFRTLGFRNIRRFNE